MKKLTAIGAVRPDPSAREEPQDNEPRHCFDEAVGSESDQRDGRRANPGEEGDAELHQMPGIPAPRKQSRPALQPRALVRRQRDVPERCDCDGLLAHAWSLASAAWRYLPPPTTLNFGFATTIREGSDQDICWAPVGRLMLKPRTRYHHVPAGSGSTTDVPSVIVPSAPWFCGLGCGVNG